MLLFLLAITNEKDHDKIIFIYDHFHDEMLRYAKLKLRGMRGLDFDAEDVVQASFLKLIQYIDAVNINKEEKALRSYLFTVVKNKITDMIAEMELHENLEDCENELIDDIFIEDLFDKETFDIIFEAMEKMPEIYKITFFYRYRENMTLNEIATFMDISINTVKSRVSRGKQLLKKLLKEYNSR